MRAALNSMWLIRGKHADMQTYGIDATGGLFVADLRCPDFLAPLPQDRVGQGSLRPLRLPPAEKVGQRPASDTQRNVEAYFADIHVLDKLSHSQ